jgi:hypothetical protein
MEENWNKSKVCEPNKIKEREIKIGRRTSAGFLSYRLWVDGVGEPPQVSVVLGYCVLCTRPTFGFMFIYTYTTSGLD